MEGHHLTIVREAELLAVSTATVRGEPRLVLTFRIDPASDFEAINLALTARQGCRLLQDLKETIRKPELFEETAPADRGERAAFEAAMFDRPPAKSEGQKKS